MYTLVEINNDFYEIKNNTLFNFRGVPIYLDVDFIIKEYGIESFESELSALEYTIKHKKHDTLHDEAEFLNGELKRIEAKHLDYLTKIEELKDRASKVKDKLMPLVDYLNQENLS